MDRKTRQTAGSCLAGNNKQKAKHAGHYGKNSAKSLFQFKNIIMYIYILLILLYYYYYLLFVLLLLSLLLLLLLRTIIIYYYYYHIYIYTPV